MQTADLKASLKVKIYADGADLRSMVALAQDPLVQGLTTNPSLMKQAGVKDYRGFAKEVLAEIKHKPISFEVFADDFKEMARQADEIAGWGDNVYVKIPITNSEGQSAAGLIRELSLRGVKLNVTALLTLPQVIETCEALKGGAPAVVSVFAGRIADTGVDPIPVMLASRELCRAAGPQVELLWASCREPFNVIEADRIGCDIITVPPALIKKLSIFGKDLQVHSLDTVKTFKADAEQSGFTL